MRPIVLCLALFAASLAVTVRSADGPRAAIPKFELPPIGMGASTSQFTPAQLAFVQSWIRQQAPECPVEASAVVAQSFLEELALRHPDKADRLLAPDFPAAAFEPMLLRHAAARLTAAAQAPLREKLAERRVAALLARAGQGPSGAPGLIAKLRDTSSVQYRRLLEGRLEDDEVLPLLRKSGQPATAPLPPGPAAPRTLTAADIVSEYSRHNQAGSALQRLQGYIIEARLVTATGEVQQLVISRLRPDRVRLVVLADGLTRLTLGADSDRFWQQAAGGKVLYAAGKDTGERRYLAEFADPLFVNEGYTFTRLPDGSVDAKTVHRIKVERPDGSGYVAWIEPGTYRQIGRENADKSIARYSDFREVAGVTFAYREEMTDAQGRKGVLELTRVTPNPGLVAAYFFPPLEPGLDYYQVERSLARPAANLGLPVLSR